jgi:hypothetical protein
MTQHAGDSPYLHRDFHAALNLGIRYLRTEFGMEAVRAYLRDFTHSFYTPLREKLQGGDLAVLAEHLRRIYATEGAEFHLHLAEDELLLEVPRCPAVSHIRSLGQEPDEAFVETTRTVNEALCEGTPFQAELLGYDPLTGAGRQRFYRRATA